MTGRTLRTWSSVHTWCSLICTAFLLIVCITGLPLVFKDELLNLIDDGKPAATLPADTANLSLDRFVESSRALYPNETIIAVYLDDDAPWAVLTLAPSWQSFEEDRRTAHWIRFDARTGQVLKESPPAAVVGNNFVGVILEIHRSLFLGLSGEIFMAGMAALFVVALVSGVIVYGPLMRRRSFGSVRRHRSYRISWLDRHSMIGIITLAWAVVIGVTGLINDLAKPLFSAWQRTNVAAMLDPYRGQPALTGENLSSAQSALETAQSIQSGMTAYSVVFPGGTSIGTPYHYLVWARGSEPLTSRLLTPALVNARTGQLDAVIAMPWFLRALQVSRPLHFGDYGGIPLKIIWALLDAATIVVLGSGIYLWFVRRVRQSGQDSRIKDVVQP